MSPPARIPEDRPGRLRVGVIGAGRVGSVLGAALHRAGHRAVAAAAVSAPSLARAARLLPEAEVLSADEVARRAELLVLAVPDDTLSDLVAGLVRTSAIRPGQIVFHTSGSHGVAVLAPAVAAGALCLALHPVMTFSGRPEDLDRITGIGYGVTAPQRLRPVAESLVVEMGGEPEWVAEADRPLYHAALAHGANHLTTLINEAMDLLREAGVAHPERMIAPLLSAAVDNTLRLADGALTGPVVRGDAGTVAGHLATLTVRAPESVAAYLALARRTADRAIHSGRLRTVDAGALLGVLTDPQQGATT
jgi:predicted short-subunit dehydrogenase-like oxidoreductase (DUF2520 family)